MENFYLIVKKCIRRFPLTCQKFHYKNFRIY